MRACASVFECVVDMCVLGVCVCIYVCVRYCTCVPCVLRIRKVVEGVFEDVWLACFCILEGVGAFERIVTHLGISS